MGKKISVIVPNHNGSSTIGACLEAVQGSGHKDFEAIIVDDCSSDGSAEIISRFPFRLIKLSEHGGASRARNEGAAAASGEILFFIDADCVLFSDTLEKVETAFRQDPGTVIGGSYAPTAHDDTFFSTFQSIFINYSELRKKEPDYIASHAMVVSRELFMNSGGFPEDFMPIIEDVEFSHRLRRNGIKLIMDSNILVRHIFNFNIFRSLKNAYRKSRYWTAYLLDNKGILSDSGTASVELKFSVLSAIIIWIFVACFILFPDRFYIESAVLIFLFSMAVSRGVISAFYRTKGIWFTVRAAAYYGLVYPFAVAAGGASGMLLHLYGNRKR